ncbi:MAG: hypothetical protein K0R84_210 [Clostridia bacterium]|jgi:hypothetical protein|nr:hypothetical protein [Clostridia bacterium]
MLGKLLKYELKATGRLFIPLYLTTLIFAVINRFLFPLNNFGEKSSAIYGIAMTISMFIYVTLIVGLMVMTLIVMIQRFYKNLLGDEGYLMFTLPVQSHKHIFSKLTVSMLWTIVSGVVAFFSILIISTKAVSMTEVFSTISTALIQFQQDFGISAYLAGFEVIVLGILSLASTILTIYAAIALGHLFNKHKLLISFGMYILLSTVSQIITSIIGIIFFSQPLFSPGGSLIPAASLANGILLGSIIYTAAFAVGYFILTNYILKRKLNLE